MRFSVVVPSFNQAAYLEATLRSILDQAGPATEIIVNDGGSRDGSTGILERHGDRIAWTSAPDRGQTDAINKGLRACRGEIVAYLNSDDVYLPGALAAVDAFFSSHPEHQILYGAAHHLHADGSFMETYPTESWNYERLFETCYLCQPAVFWRRELHAEFGFFDERLNFAMDYEFWLRVGSRVPFAYLSGQPLAGSRLHADTKTVSQRVPAHREILQVVRRHARTARQTYTWLRHLANLTAQARGLPPSGDPALHRRHLEAYGQNVFSIADELRIELDGPFLRELESLLKTVPAVP